MVRLQKTHVATAILIMAAFVAGVVISTQLSLVQADTRNDGYSNQVIEILEAGSPTGVYSQPDATSASTQQVDLLRWGDRVMWDGVTSSTDGAGNRWIRVAIGEGVTGWMIANLADNGVKLKISSPIYTTPSMAVGKTAVVTQMGNHANFRTDPTVIPGRDNIMRLVEAGEQLVVVGGPYQAEYFVWWQYQDANGQRGWIVDIEGWFQVTN